MFFIMYDSKCRVFCVLDCWLKIVVSYSPIIISIMSNCAICKLCRQRWQTRANTNRRWREAMLLLQYLFNGVSQCVVLDKYSTSLLGFGEPGVYRTPSQMRCCISRGYLYK